MRCPQCSADVSAGADRCPRCARALAGPQVATGVLTPYPPDSPTLHPDEPTLPTGVAGRAAAEDSGPAEAMTRLPGEPASTNDEPAGPLKVGERFGTRYRITRLLGVGGMGAVYEAWDGELGVPVALKVIRSEMADDSAAVRSLERRFKRELLLARQVTHRNVVRIHDLGEIDGIKYITMPYIDGRDLGTILRAEG